MPDIKLTASLDTTQAMSSIHEIRSQLGMALASATGFNNAAMAMAGYPNLGGSGFGQTFTNPAMAYSPHYGAIQAHTTLQQEWLVGRYGLEAAQAMKPPGVSSATYAMGAMSNAIDRDVEAKQQAQLAGQSAFFTGAGGLLAGSVAERLAAPVGAYVGGRIGARLLGGAGGVGAGKLLGGLAVGWAAFDWANDFASKHIGEHFAQIEQIGGATSELGQLAGGGRGLGRLQQYNLGVAARQAAGDLKMDVQEMGGILALSRQAGMLPTATDPGKARQQFRDFARTIEEGAQVLQTSLAGATQVIKTAVQQGMSAQEGIARAAGAGGAGTWLRQQAMASSMGMMGMRMGFAPHQGAGMFMRSLGAAYAAGLSEDETMIMGGEYGAAQFVASTQMSMAASPMGDMQMMAAMGGGDLSGTGMMGVAGAAIEAMGQGGDFLSNMGKFMVHRNEYRRGIGARGIQTMAREQLRMGGEMLSQLMPGLSNNEAQRMYAISMGLNPDQAKTLVGGGAGGGGMGTYAQARAVIAMQEQRLGSMGALPNAEKLAAADDARRAEWGISGAIEGAGWGLMGGLKGAAVGAAVGFVAQNYQAMKQTFFGGPPLFESAEVKADYYRRQAAAEYDQRMAAAREKIGYVELDEEVTGNFLRSNLGSARLSYDAAGQLGGYTSRFGTVGREVTAHGRNVAVTEAALRAMGATPVAAGPGTIEVNGQYWNIHDYQRIANSHLWDDRVSASTTRRASMLAYDALSGLGEGSRGKRAYLSSLWGDIVAKKPDAAVAARELMGATEEMIGLLPAGKDRQWLEREFARGGLGSGAVRKFMGGIAGIDFEGLDAAYTAAVGGGAAALFGVNRLASNEANFLAEHYGGVIRRNTREAVLKGYLGDLYGDDSASAVIGTMLTTEGREALARATPSETIYEAAKRTGISTARLFSQGALRGDLTAEEAAIALQGAIGPRAEGMNFDDYLKSHGYGAGLTADNLRKQYYQKLVQHPKYIKAKAAAARGNVALAQQYMDQAQKLTYIEGGITFEGFEPARIDVTQEVTSGRAASGTIKALDTAFGGLRGLPLIGEAMARSAQEHLGKKMQQEVLKKFSFAEIAHAENAKGGIGKLRKRRRKAGQLLQRAVGFGAREEALTTINKSLRHSERMLKDTGKAIASLANEINSMKNTNKVGQ